MSKKITVLVPTFNHSRFIDRCLRSLLSQSLAREFYEILIVDDASTDCTSEILKKYINQVNLVTNESNIGLPGSLNIGLRLTKTPYVVRVDSDDYVSEDFLLVLLRFIEMNEFMDAVACDYNLVDDEGKFLERRFSEVDPIACGVIFKTDQLFDIGLYDVEFKLHEDIDLRHRFIRKFKIENIKLPLYRYRRHNQNITNNKVEDLKHRELLKRKHMDI